MVPAPCRRPCARPAIDPALLCVHIEGLQVTGIAEGGGTDADHDARLVHHLKHLRQPSAFLTNEVADCSRLAVRRVCSIAETKHYVRGSAVAHLVVETRQGHIIADHTGLRLQVLGNDEQRNVLDA